MATVIERETVRVRPTGAALAADIEGVNLAGALAPETIDAIKAAWGDHLVLRFRGQSLGDDDLMRFSRQFGELDWAPIAATNDAPEGREYIMVVSNVVENGQPIGQLGAYEAVWHTDMSYVPAPPMASALYSLEAPPSGGDTGFCNMYLAYDTLRPNCGATSMAGNAGTTPAATAPANCAAALSMRPTRRRWSGRSTRSCAPIRRPAARRCSWGGGPTPISPG